MKFNELCESLLEEVKGYHNKNGVVKMNNYSLLSRLALDCEYFLGHGDRCHKHLWAGNPVDQIKKMKELYNGLAEKPEWITMDDITSYEKKML